MNSPLQSPSKYPSTTPKRVHFEDPRTTKSRVRSNSSRLPQSPYPEALELGSSTPTLKTESWSPEFSPIARLRQNINYLYQNQPVPVLPSSPPFDSGETGTGIDCPIHSQFQSNPKVPESQEVPTPVTRSAVSTSILSPDYSETSVPTFGIMAQPFGNTGAGGALDYQPQVPDTRNGPEGYYYVPRHDEDYLPALGFGTHTYPQVAPLPFQQPFQSLQPLQPLPMQHPRAFPLMGQPPFAMSLQPLVAPRPVIHQPIPQPATQPMVYHPGSHGLPQPLYLQQPTPQGQLVPGNGTNPMAMSLAAAGGGTPDPAFGIGLTSSEVATLNEEYAARSNVDEPQDFRPADPDPSRMYRVRELDGTWVLFSRATIERGSFRWYITDDGAFYAVRLPN